MTLYAILRLTAILKQQITLKAKMFYFVPLSDYNKMMGTNETLASDEALLFQLGTLLIMKVLFPFEHGMTYTIKKQIDKFRPDGNSMANISTIFVLIVPDIHAAVDAIAALPGNESLFTFIGTITLIPT